MAELPYQTANKFTGLPGSWQDKLRKGYELLTGKTDYRGTAAQNTMVQKAMQNGSLSQKIGQTPQPATPAATAQPKDVFDSIKDTGLQNELLKQEIAFEELNPFSQFFNKDLAKEVVQAAYKGEFDRLQKIQDDLYIKNKTRANQDFQLNKDQMNEDDATYKAREAKAFEQSLNQNNQNYANSGSFFSGAREGQQDLMTEERNNNLNDYATRFARALMAMDTQNARFNEDIDYNKGITDFEMDRQNKRTIDQEVNAMEDEKLAGWQDEKKRYYENPLYYGTTAGDAKLKELEEKKRKVSTPALV